MPASFLTREPSLPQTTLGGVNALLGVVEWIERWVFRIVGALVEQITALLVRILRRGRFRAWRRGA